MFAEHCVANKISDLLC